MDEVKIQVAGGGCELRFSPGSLAGPDGSDTSPGVGFALTSRLPAFQSGNGSWHHGIGVIGRADAARLRDMLEIFLKSCARGEAA